MQIAQQILFILISALLSGFFQKNKRDQPQYKAGPG
jgi:hypothetical protein